MAVNLSPYGGVGAQFLDNSGNVLTGGKIFTYAAGTTTNQPTYTTSAGNVPHSNPIILDASGRVPSGGEIWLTDGLSYKFILRDANDVLIATYDNVTGINSNFVAFTNQQEIQTATAGQTVFNLTTMTYQPATNSLTVFVDGVNQYGPGAQYAYVETDSDTVTFVNGLHVGASVKFTTSQLNSSASQSDAFQVSYTPPFTGSVATSVGDKLAQTVSVTDFGAVGDGVTDDTVAIQAAHDASIQVFYPSGTYNISSSIVLGFNAQVIGEGNITTASSGTGTIINATTSAYAYTQDAVVNSQIQGARFSNVRINCQNGIRLNTIAGGQPGQVGVTQGIIMNPSLKNVTIVQNGTNGTGNGLLACVTFHLEVTEQCDFGGFENNINIYYSDFALISHIRSYGFGNSAIQLTAANTFGSHSLIENNDLLGGITGATAFIVCNDYSPSIINNYLEQVQAQGTGLTAAIVCIDNRNLTIRDNVVQFPGVCGPNWLNVSNTDSLKILDISNNSLEAIAIGPATFNAGLGLRPLNTGNSLTTRCIHSGNTFEDGIPITSKTRADLPNSPFKTVSIITPNLIEAIPARDYNAVAYIKDNEYVLPPSVTGNSAWFQDPDQTLVGTVDVYILAYASGSQQLATNVTDNFGSPTGSVITLTTTPTWYTITTGKTISTSMQVLLNASTVYGANTVYVQSIVVNRP